MGCAEGIWWDLEEKDRGIDTTIFHHIYEIVKNKESNKKKKLIKYIFKGNFFKKLTLLCYLVSSFHSLSEFNDCFSVLT